uniref:Uncharacterized protein n=1 Tax=Trypanosoma vivax (strain Y486) TaxID=1055687 RepID=G0U9X7_TRYVY|nr:conserved hypothetical protein, fragment [Trypanosoma vivax Y486]
MALLADTAPNPSLVSPSPLAMLVPKDVRPLMTSGGSEVVVETRLTGQKRLFVHIFDEKEREEAKRPRTVCSSFHERSIEELNWARATLWGDAQLKEYLRTPDWLTWPSLSELEKMVDLVRSLKETDTLMDYAASGDLKKAFNVVRREALYTGVHPLREEALSGPLVMFEATTGDGCTTGDSLRVVNTGCTAPAEQSPGGTVWVLDLNTPRFTVDEVLRLTLTRRVQEACVQLVRPMLAAASVGELWADVVAAHRNGVSSHGRGLFYSPHECITDFGATVSHVAKLVYEAVCGSLNATGLSLDVCEKSGMILRISDKEPIEEALRLRFLSPLSSSYECRPAVKLTSSTHMTHVVVEHNPSVVVHGYRVVGAFPENIEARDAVSELLLAREGAVPPAPPSQAKEDVKPSLTQTASAVVTGEDLRRGVDEAIVRTLIEGAMTKGTLCTHPNMAPFRSLPNFDSLLKDSLRRNAEFRGKKYYLKE